MKPFIALLKAVATTGLILLISACASSVPLEDQDRDIGMKQFEKPKEGIAVYVVQYGGTLTQHRINFQVFINSKLVGVMSGHTYSVHRLPPGTHTLLVSSPENQEVLKFSGKDGEIIFIAVGSHGGWAQMRASDLRLLGKDEGKKAVFAARLSKGLSK